MEFLLICLVIGLLPAAIAHHKGYDFLPYWLYGSALFLIALPHVLMMKTKAGAVEARELSTGDKRKCPHCAELVKREAKVCRYCQRTLDDPAKPVAAPTDAQSSFSPFKW
jgi:hypothetical protein